MKVVGEALQARARASDARARQCFPARVALRRAKHVRASA